MLLRFDDRQEFLDYFDEEDNTLHRGYMADHRFRGNIPETYPVILQSGPGHLAADVIFRAVDVRVTEEDERERLFLQAARTKEMIQEQECSMRMREVRL